VVSDPLKEEAMARTKKWQSVTNWISLLLFVTFCGCSGGGGSSGSVSTPRVSGTTTGLLGTGLVLQNNSADNLEITENGYFSFSKSSPIGSPYNVRILSQPTAPAQQCEVVNGSGIVSASLVNELAIVCTTGFMETFDNGGIDSGYWNNAGEFERKLEAGALKYRLKTASEFAANYIYCQETGSGTVSADVAVIDADKVGTGEATFGTRIESSGYHSPTKGEAPGNRTGDVVAAIMLNGTTVSYQVFRCLTDECSDAKTVDYLTKGEGLGVPLGSVSVGATSRLLVDWDTLAAGRFTFQLNNDPPISFDPVRAGAPIASLFPNYPIRYIGPKLSLSNPGDIADMTATFDNVVTDRIIYDDFETGTYLDGSLWKQTNGRIALEGGRLLVETGQEYTGDTEADSRFNVTEQKTHKDLIPDAAVVEADMELSSSSFLVDSGSIPAEVRGFLTMDFSPPDASIKDYTDTFTIEAALLEDPSGVKVRTLARGCVDSRCVSTYPIVNDNRVFTTPVAKGEVHRVKIADLGNSMVAVTLDEAETITFDLSEIPAFATTKFTRMRFGTQTRGTDTTGEEAFARAYFDNIRLGAP